jgi:hypothetical protein
MQMSHETAILVTVSFTPVRNDADCMGSVLS